MQYPLRRRTQGNDSEIGRSVTHARNAAAHVERLLFLLLLVSIRWITAKVQSVSHTDTLKEKRLQLCRRFVVFPYYA